MSLSTKTTRTASGSGTRPSAADLRAALNGVPDGALVRINVATPHQLDRGPGSWTFTAEWEEALTKPHPSGFPTYPPGARSPDGGYTAAARR